VNQLVGFLMVEPAHPGLSHRLGMSTCIFLDLFIIGFNDDMLSMVGDVPLDSGHLWGLRESRDLLVRSFGGAHTDRVCVRVFIGVSLCS
jgi:hypothetical protein